MNTTPQASTGRTTFDSFFVRDFEKKEVKVTLEGRGEPTRISFTKFFSTQEGSFISYIEKDANSCYAPEVVRSIMGVWYFFPEDKRGVLVDFLRYFREVTAAWDMTPPENPSPNELRIFESEKKEQAYTLSTCDWLIKRMTT